MKRCYRCKNEKDESEFGIDRSRKDGLMAACKLCRSEISKNKYLSIRDEYLAKCKIYYQDNKELISNRRNQSKEKDPDRKKIWSKNYRSKNKEKINEYMRNYYHNVYFPKHKERLKPKWRDASRKRMEDISYRIHRSISASVWKSLKGQKNERLEKILGYAISDLITHLENQFINGMSINNYGEWHIDHKIPISFFKFNSTNDDGFRNAWSLNNLQPLWAHDNFSKSNIIGGHRVKRNKD